MDQIDSLSPQSPRQSKLLPQYACHWPGTMISQQVYFQSRGRLVPTFAQKCSETQVGRSIRQVLEHTMYVPVDARPTVGFCQ